MPPFPPIDSTSLPHARHLAAPPLPYPPFPAEDIILPAVTWVCFPLFLTAIFAFNTLFICFAGIRKHTHGNDFPFPSHSSNNYFPPASSLLSSATLFPLLSILCPLLPTSPPLPLSSTLSFFVYCCIYLVQYL
jgi:hypothetical protein